MSNVNACYNVIYVKYLLNDLEIMKLYIKMHNFQSITIK